MASIMHDFFIFLGVNPISPINFAEFIPWFIMIMLCCCVISVIFKGFFSLVNFFSKGSVKL